MAELNTSNAEEVLAACKLNGEDIAGTLSRALDGQYEVTAPESTSIYRKSEIPDEWNGPGLATIFTIGDIGVLVLLPEESGFTPDWYASPDPTGVSKLATMGQELGMLLVPETFLADDYQAGRVSCLADAVERGRPAENTALIRLSVKSGDKQAHLDLLWPLTKPHEILAEAIDEVSGGGGDVAAEDGGNRVSHTTPVSTKADQPRHDDAFDRLPPYIRSMLQVEVPVQVTLASKKESISAILALTPGAIINFEKPCDQLLDLEVGDHRIAQGEAVKVGDKFGLRISTVVLPDERFARLHG